ncbi:MAG: type II toxin-antitoxin system VapC family toxin [Betaproteobacteria bacterium]|nr:type II toxin-antitoxin system VapC family toxin [Betaproteobacteria bacterium]MCL2886612.1 type II toxin-antitoxin system VapC family toxin [Betaproteobacteria bacterium]
MKLLLDTCTFLWWIAEHPGMSDKAAQALGNPDNPCWLSVASLWEILVKQRAHRLDIDSGAQAVFDFLCEQCRINQIELLPVLAGDIRHVSQLPDIHHDPFDRLLICQTIENGLTLVTPDRNIQRYPIRTFW